MLLAITGVGKSTVAAIKVAFERLLTCVDSLVNLEVLRPGEHLSAARERTGERFFSRVHADVVHQFVLGLEWSAFSRAAVPEAGVVRDFRSPYVFHGEMSDDLMQSPKDLIARLLW